jgi:hypothetical protein
VTGLALHRHLIQIVSVLAIGHCVAGRSLVLALLRRANPRVLKGNPDYVLGSNSRPFIVEESDLVNCHPSSLAQHKVVVDVLPLAVSDYRVANSEKYGDKFHFLPPPGQWAFPVIARLIPLVCGFIGGLWAWPAMREGRTSRTDGYHFLDQHSPHFLGMVSGSSFDWRLLAFGLGVLVRERLFPKSLWLRYP